MKNLYFLFVFSLFILLFSPNLTIAQQSLSGIEQDNNSNNPCEILEDNTTLWGWGLNDCGQLGDGTKVDRPQPIQIGKDQNWKMVVSSIGFSVGIKSDGSLWAWGDNADGQLGDGTKNSYSTPHQIGNEKTWKFISAGWGFTLAIKNDGTLWGWGKNNIGQLGDSTTIYRNTPVQIGKIITGAAKYVYASYYYSVAITEDGSLWAWGDNADGALGDGTTIGKLYPVKIGNSGEWLTANCVNDRTAAIKKDGTLWFWGCNVSDQCNDGTYGIKQTPFQIGNDADWAEISLQHKSQFAIKKDGTLWAWGYNDMGQLGDGTTGGRRLEPIQIGKDKDWLMMSTGEYHTLALKKDGTLWEWGYHNSQENFIIPTKVGRMNDVVQMSTNASFLSLFIRKYVAILPNVITQPISDITANSAISGGNLISQGSETEITRGVCISTNPNPTINDITTKDGSGLGKYQSTLSNLTPITKYFVRAYAQTPAGTAYGQEENFKTKLSLPILISPINGKTGISLDQLFEWNNVGYATKYRIQLSKSINFSGLIFDEVTTQISFDYQTLELNTQYYWRVQASNSIDSSNWSEVWSFTTTKFIKQTLISPIDNSINIPIDNQLNWNPNVLSSSYILVGSKSKDFKDLAVDTTLSQNFFKCLKLDYLELYYWKVRSFIEMDSSDWSPVWRFTTLMDSVNLITPSDVSANLELIQNLNWDKGIYEKNYHLQVSKDDYFNYIVFDSTFIGATTATIKNLEYYTKYFWRVRNESADTLGYWSKIWQFKTKMSDIFLIYPENVQTGLEQEINFKWSYVKGAEYYQLQISKNDQFTNLVYSMDSITATEKLVPDLEKDILYYWRVRVWNTESIGTAYWSEVWTFRTGETGVKDEYDVIQIIPNPAGDFITVSLKPSEGFEPSEGSEILIYNTLGEKVMSESIHPMTASHRMNIESLPKGIYFVKVGGETAKFVKM